MKQHHKLFKASANSPPKTPINLPITCFIHSEKGGSFFPHNLHTERVRKRSLFNKPKEISQKKKRLYTILSYPNQQSIHCLHRANTQENLNKKTQWKTRNSPENTFINSISSKNLHKTPRFHEFIFISDHSIIITIIPHLREESLTSHSRSSTSCIILIFVA